MTQGSDRLTHQLEHAQLAEIAELERCLAVYGALLTETERKLNDARRRHSDTTARLSEEDAY